MKETVYDHIDGSPHFTVTAAESWSKTMIKNLKKRRPDEVDITHINSDGSMVAHIPIEWMRIVPKRRDTLTDEQREERRERMAELRRAQLSKNEDS